MKGDGGFGGFLSLGRERDVGTSGGGDDSSTRLDMISSLSRNGLNILAGGGGRGTTGVVGFSLKAANWGDGGERASAKVSGSGFSGFYRARTAARPAQQTEEAAAAAVPALEKPPRADVENLSPDECWRLILKLGKRWPAWNKPTLVLPSPQEKSSSLGHEPAQVGQVSLDFLATRALEALAQTPDRHDRPPRRMLAPKMTTQEFLRTAAGRDPPTPTPTPMPTATATSSQLEYQTLPVYQPSVSSMDALKLGSSRTAPLTIFYAGTVNVCEDVPEDKARLIMLFAEKAGIKPSARAPARSASPSSSGVRPGEDLQLAPPASSPAAAALVDPSSAQAPSHLSTRAEDSTAAEGMAMPPALPLIVTATQTISRQQQGPAKPLPNARKSSLARFLDSRKRPKSTSGLEGQPSKRHSGASDGCPSDAEDSDRGKSTIDSGRGKSTIDSGRGKSTIDPGQGKSTIDLVKERNNINTDNAEVRP